LVFFCDSICYWLFHVMKARLLDGGSANFALFFSRAVGGPPTRFLISLSLRRRRVILIVRPTAWTFVSPSQPSGFSLKDTWAVGITFHQFFALRRRPLKTCRQPRGPFFGVSPCLRRRLSPPPLVLIHRPLLLMVQNFLSWYQVRAPGEDESLAR